MLSSLTMQHKPAEHGLEAATPAPTVNCGTAALAVSVVVAHCKGYLVLGLEYSVNLTPPTLPVPLHLAMR